MKYFLTYIIITIFFSCKHVNMKDQKNYLDEIPLIVELSIGDEEDIFMTFENRSDETIKISNPKYWSNISFVLRKEKEMLPQIKIKPNQEHMNDYIIFNPLDVKKIAFSYKMGNVFPTYSKEVKYFLEMFFWGKIEINNKTFELRKNRILQKNL